jgi:RimJ/RimL family protein N-acetyltransferase
MFQKVFCGSRRLRNGAFSLILILSAMGSHPAEATISCKEILGSVKYFFLKRGKGRLEKVFLEMNRMKELSFKSERLIFKNLESADLDQAEELLGGSQTSFFRNTSSSGVGIYSAMVFGVINLAINPFVYLPPRANVASNELALYSLKDKKLVGFLGADFDFCRKRIYISYVIEKSSRGQGYATEALATFMHYIQQNVEERVIFMGTVYKSNFSSIKVLEKTGFEFIGDDGQSADIYLYRK